MENPIHVIDADLTSPYDVISDIHVWYDMLGESSQHDMPGFDFLNWLPLPIRSKFSYTLRNYWYGIHPHQRNEHIAAYLAERSNLYQIIQQN